jgi:hypothetical protein
VRNFLSAERLLWDPSDDPAGHEALEAWARDEGLWYEGDPFVKTDAQTEREVELFERIVAALIATIRDLHETGTLAAIFGRDVPVLLDHQDSHDPFPKWNQQANPPELYAQFGPYLESIWSPEAGWVSRRPRIQDRVLEEGDPPISWLVRRSTPMN